MTQPADPPVPETAMGLGLPPFIKRVVGPSSGLAPGAGGAKGLGWYGASSRPQAPGVFEFLEMGSPRLALARALGVPFAPWCVNLTAIFNSASPSVVADVGADTKFVQDCYFEAIVARVLSQNTPASSFDTMSDFFGNWQNAFEIKLRVAGAPRYDVYPKYCLLSNAVDMLNAGQFVGWILTYNQNLEMDIQSTFALATSQLPVKVQVTCRTRAPIGEAFSRMTNDEAFRRLSREFGIECADDFVHWHCR